VDWIEAAINAHDERPLWTLRDVIEEIDARRAFLMQGARSAVVLTVSDEYRRTGEKVAEAWLAGGDLAEITAGIPQLEAWARANGCTQAHITGRKGWVRALAPFGYEHWATTVRKLL
jgi:hypothetical protein